MNGDKLDHVDDCMKMLGISLNLLDPKGAFGGPAEIMSQMQIMETVKDDYRNLSDAILALREEPKTEGNWIIVGEPGPELISIPSGATVISNVHSEIDAQELARKMLAMISDAQATINDRDLLSGVLDAMKMLCKEHIKEQ